MQIGVNLKIEFTMYNLSEVFEKVYLMTDENEKMLLHSALILEIRGIENELCNIYGQLGLFLFKDRTFVSCLGGDMFSINEWFSNNKDYLDYLSILKLINDEQL